MIIDKQKFIYKNIYFIIISTNKFLEKQHSMPWLLCSYTFIIVLFFFLHLLCCSRLVVVVAIVVAVIVFMSFRTTTEWTRKKMSNNIFCVAFRSFRMRASHQFLYDVPYYTCIFYATLMVWSTHVFPLSLSLVFSLSIAFALSFSVRHVGRCLVCAHFDCACFFLICFAGHFFPKGNWQLPHRHFEGKLEKNVPLTSTDDFRNKNNHKRPAYLVGHDNQLKKALHQNLHSTATVCERFFLFPSPFILAFNSYKYNQMPL